MQKDLQQITNIDERTMNMNECRKVMCAHDKEEEIENLWERVNPCEIIQRTLLNVFEIFDCLPVNLPTY